ncbi:P-loop containing nucleoside triphosphate hydrolase protein [Calocera viscosa TUFC12733]|uniref:RNA helicase n=1 Tax=Calocera viscosa (strain TUFC12733) TaxID=1330018 RepID=A0A167IB66_CALVF|nr:P-loop containing nucleoside triphosphate hydrolase protein [Calocera viscosa TUFC12733]
MPPQQRKHIVKSGNAGNSSKGSTTPTKAPEPAKPSDAPPPLFPPGVKTPLALLYERCQKNGWEKPFVDPVRLQRSHPKQNKKGTFDCFITLRKRNTKAPGGMDTVVLHPIPALELKTAQEAKHWGATYALHRFSKDRVYMFLPQGPRDYWNKLQAWREQHGSEAHQEWMWSADPFAAQKEVEQRQAVAEKKHPERAKVEQQVAALPMIGDASAKPRGKGWREWEEAVEVRMAPDLRVMVESAIKSMADQYPDLLANTEDPSSANTPANSILSEQLLTLGFPVSLIPAAVSSRNATLSTALTYLLLHTPEPLLPPAFKATASSAPFITAAHSHSGEGDLQRRWAGDRLVEIGWPRAGIEVLEKGLEGVRWDGTVASGLEVLNARLCETLVEETEGTPDEQAKEEELAVLESMHPNLIHNDEGTEYAVPIPDSPLQLHVLLSQGHPYPSEGNTRLPPFYIAVDPAETTQLTAWDRLGLMQKLCLTARSEWNEFLQDGQGIVSLMADWLEANWEEEVKTTDPGALVEVLLPEPALLIPPRRAPKLAQPAMDKRPARGTRARKLDDSKERALFAKLRKEKEYLEMEAQRKKLPAFSMQQQIVDVIGKNNVTVIVGETGCGKTTQLPQFILDAALLSSAPSVEPISILITQPRRLSALGVAGRVANERCETRPGVGTVGYAIRGESRSSDRTRLLFVTTGVALRMLTNEDGLKGFTHVIVDEVHERSVDSDFLLLELREMLRRGADIKVVLMSATINQEVFVKYFDNAPVITIPGYTHPVADHYLEDIIPHISYRPPFVKPRSKQSDEQLQAYRKPYAEMGLSEDQIRAIESISRTDRIDYQLVAAVVGHIVRTSPDEGAILIFMPGVAEIKQCMSSLSAMRPALILPLHANLSPAEQKLVFPPPPKGQRKIIVATNVAETSITIPDIVHVVDAGRVKENEYDPESGLSRLVESWVPRAGAKQRRGRAGRTQKGDCWKIYTRRMESDYMPSFSVPEMLRVPLERLTLQVKVTKEDVDAKTFLLKAISPPKISALDQAWVVLRELGAIDASDGLTALGRHLALLPMDLRLAKMLILATIFRCLDPILTVVACLSSKPLFNNPMEQREEAKLARSRFVAANSDLLTDANAFAKCRDQGKSQSQIRSFCEASFMSPSTVRDITSLRQDFHSTLSDIGFVPFSSSPTDEFLNVNSHNQNLLKAIILGGLWSRVARIALPKAQFERVAGGTIQKDHTARELKFFDNRGSRVFLHPQSALFAAMAFRTPYVAYFSKAQTSKVFLRDATEVPLYGILLFGGTVLNDPIHGGLSVDRWIKMKAWTRIGVLVNQLRRCLDGILAKTIEDATLPDLSADPVCQAMLSLLERDGLGADSI